MFGCSRDARIWRSAMNFSSKAAAGVIDQHPAHDAGCHSEELCPLAPLHPALVHEAEKRLVHEGAGVEGVVRPLAPQLAPRELLELGVDEGRETVEGVGVATAPCTQQLGHLRRFGIRAIRRHDPPCRRSRLVVLFAQHE